MYESLKIGQFRAFSSFEIAGLTRVNLLVGKNNAGKTSLLDAVEVAALGGHIASLLKSPKRRGEVSFEMLEDRSRFELNISHLFFGHRFEAGTWFAITTRSDGVDSVVRCTIRPDDSHGPEIEDLFASEAGPATPLAVEMTGPDSPSGQSTLPVTVAGVLGYRRSGTLTSTANVAFLGTDGAEPGALQPIWDRLVLTPEEEKVITAMRIIEPAIDRLAFVSAGMRPGGAAFVKLSGQDERVPLGSLGDGIRRLLAIAIHMARASGGVLLIDEIDTGLHYSTMESMWQFVIESARRLDVQVFATSHSGDCVRALAWLQSDAPELASEVSVHRIDRTAPAAVRYSAEEIAIAARHHVEVRG